jgi:hypothetical protein
MQLQAQRRGQAVLIPAAGLYPPPALVGWPCTTIPRVETYTRSVHALATICAYRGRGRTPSKRGRTPVRQQHVLGLHRGAPLPQAI